MALPIPGWLQSILNNPMVAARVKAGIASASVAVGAGTLTFVTVWLTQHASFLSQSSIVTIAGIIASAAAALVMAVQGVIYPQKDVTTVDAKVKAAAITGSAASANDKDVVSQVRATAGSREALADLEAKLNTGKV